MPEISRFFGIVIAMYYSDHAPPHFHARYGSFEIRVEVATGEVLSGSLSPRARRMVIEWWSLHREELGVDWDRAAQREQLLKIEPLE